MATDRTRGERNNDDQARAAIRVVLDQALENVVSWIAADRLDLDPDVCERWVDRMWNDLRDSLDDEQRLWAIMMLIEDEANERARELLADPECAG